MITGHKDRHITIVIKIKSDGNYIVTKYQRRYIPIKKEDKSAFNNLLVNLPRELTSLSVCGSEFQQSTDRLKNYIYISISLFEHTVQQP